MIDNTAKVMLSDGYSVEIDPLNFTLKQKRKITGQDGKEKTVEKIVGYYGSLQQCVEKIIQCKQLDDMAGMEIPIDRYVLMAANSNRKTLEEIKVHISAIENMLKTIREDKK